MNLIEIKNIKEETQMKLIELKIENHNMSLQEQRFFGGEDGIRKTYLKDLKKYELD